MRVFEEFESGREKIGERRNWREREIEERKKEKEIEESRKMQVRKNL